MLIRCGSSGDTVAAIQTRLKELGLYAGPIDSSYGGGTEGAIKTFQKNSGVPVDGEVGPNTWARLFPSEPAPKSALLDQPVATRCLALTGSFETSTLPPDCFCGVTGDFDDEGLSFGALQWNIGQGSLQPLFTAMIEQHRPVCESIFHEHLATIEAVLAQPRPEQLSFVRGLQDHRHRMIEPWLGALRTLGRTAEFQAIQSAAASKVFNRALAMAKEYGVESQRGVALMFDIVTQNGSISAEIKSQILSDFAALPLGPGPERDTERLRIIARRRSAAARPQFQADVLKRKLTIAEGTGTVHGVPYDLERQFGLTLDPIPLSVAAPAR